MTHPSGAPAAVGTLGTTAPKDSHDDIARPPLSIVGRDTWAEEHRRHLDREKELTRRRDELAVARRSLPWLEITEPYVFGTTEGPATLVDLFDGTQNHLAARDTSLVAVSRAPLPEIQAYRDRMGWGFRWVSSSPGRFNIDPGVGVDGADPDSGRRDHNFGTQDFGGDEAPGFSAFARDPDDRVFLTHQTFSRGLDPLNAAYQMLDLTAAGRNEDGLDWSMQWLRRHDDYEG